MNEDLRRALYELQNERCGICGADGTHLVLDHDHITGLVRGLLCKGCNLDEGRHPINCGARRRQCAICWWRDQPAVTWLGWTERYVSSYGDSPFDALHEIPATFQALEWLTNTRTPELRQQVRAKFHDLVKRWPDTTARRMCGVSDDFDMDGVA